MVDIHSLEDRPSPGRMELNDLGVVRFRLADPLVVDPYVRNRGTGAFILIDESTQRDGRRRHGGRRAAVTHEAPIPTATRHVIDSRAPRTNQAVIGLVSVLAVATGWWWLLALLALQLAVGLRFGRRFCLPCVAYFELIQPRFGEGPLEDSRPPRAANMVGLVVLARRVGRLRRRPGHRSAPGSGSSSPRSPCSQPSPGSAPAARPTSSAVCSAAGRSSPARSRRARVTPAA